MLSISEKILMSVNSKQKPLYQLATTDETGNSKKMTKARLGQWFVVYATTRSLIS